MSAGAHSLTAAERETLATGTDADAVVTIITYQRRHITALRKHPGFREKASGFHGTSEWAEFTIPADRWSPATGAKRAGRPLSADERARAAARLAAARSASTARSAVPEDK
jgi:hypothetical protein